MFQAKQLIEFNRERINRSSNIIETDNDKHIKEIITQIELTTGWEYIGDCFILRTNFKYYRARADITFDIYKVERNNSHYTSVNGNNQELSFIEKNELLLQKLETYQKNQITFDYNPSKEIMKFQEKMLKEEASTFIKVYSYPGIYNLVYFLNRITNSNNIENEYQELLKREDDLGYIEQVLKWSNLYTGKGKLLYKKHYLEIDSKLPSQNKKAYVIKLPK